MDLKPEKNLLSVKKIAHPPLQYKDGQRGNDHHWHFRHMGQFHQSVADGANVLIEPPGTHDLNKKINKNRIHSYHGEERQMLPVFSNVNPPITNSQTDQAPATRGDGERTGRDSFDDWGDRPVHAVTDY